MHYMIMVYREETPGATPTPDPLPAELAAWFRELAGSSRVPLAGGLRPAATAATVREIPGGHSVAAGPALAAQPQLSGFQIVDCRDRDEALAIARRFPGLERDGVSVEVRQVMTDAEESLRFRDAEGA